MIQRPTPGLPAPELTFKLTDETNWVLSERRPRNFTLLSFYRGLHCPVCKKHLQQLQGLKSEFENLGIELVVASMDTPERAIKAKEIWGLNNLDLGYGLTLEGAKEWGLYVSKAIKKGEPKYFSEPGLFLIDVNRIIYYSAMFSNPWGRPDLLYFLKGINYILDTCIERSILCHPFR